MRPATDDSGIVAVVGVVLLILFLGAFVACAIVRCNSGQRVTCGPDREFAEFKVTQASFFTDSHGAWGALDVARGYYCAIWTLAQGTPIELRAEGRSCTVTVQDRGPHKRLVARGRALDLSPQAFGTFWPHSRGVAMVAYRTVKGGE